MWKPKPMSKLETSMQQGPVVETAVVSVATKLGMGGGSATSAFGWLTSNNTVVVVGLLVTVLGFMVSLFFQRRRDKRETRESEQKIAIARAEEKRKQELHLIQMKALKRRSTDGE